MLEIKIKEVLNPFLGAFQSLNACMDNTINERPHARTSPRFFGHF